jgi:DNA-binding NarL/FixJ family response regulator
MIRIVVADDHRLIREGLCALIQSEPDMEVVGEAANGRDLVALVAKKLPGVVLMDVTMPQLNGVEATRQIIDVGSPARVIAVSMHNDRHVVQSILDAGAVGYVLKDAAFDELADAVRIVNSGKTYLSPSVDRQAVDRVAARPKKRASGSPLSAREREVLQLVAEGHSTRVIAQELHIGIKTVETHRRQVMNKLEIFSVAGLTKYAVRNGMSSLEV